MPLTPIDPATLGIQWRGYRDGSTPTFGFGVSENSLEMTCFVLWNKIADAVIHFVGRSAIDGTGTAATLDRLTPYFHTEFPGLICTKVVSITGHGPNGTDSNGYPKYRHAELRLLFESVPFPVLDNSEVSSELERYVEIGPTRGAASAITFPGGAMKYSLSPDQTSGYPPEGYPVPFNISRIVPEEQFSTRWHRLPEAVWANDGTSPLKNRIYGTGEYDTIPYLGCINDAEFLGRPTGTVLFESVDADPQRSPLGDGSIEYVLTYNFRFKPTGFNWIYWTRPNADIGESDFYMISCDGSHYTADVLPDGTSIYNSRPFDWLYNVAEG